jgi:hypothetical protein
MRCISKALQTTLRRSPRWTNRNASGTATGTSCRISGDRIESAKMRMSGTAPRIL